MLRFFGFLFAVGMIVFVTAAAGAAFLLWKTSQELPDYEALANYEPPVMTRLHAHDGSLIAEYARERRLYVPMNGIPALLVNAFISAEDKNFYQHGGLDVQGILRAVVTNVNNLQSGRRPVGASTITQQVAKNFLLTNDLNYERKIKEAILAIRIERAFTKEQILELYLNEIYLGLHSYGVAAAALNYWGKSLNELSLSDVAYLAALPKGPNNYHPFRKTEEAIERRNWVIDRMVENGYATADEGEKAKASPLNVDPRPFGAHIYAAEFFAEEVRREIIALFGEKKLYEGGLSVRTTLDPNLQQIARKVLVDGLVDYDRRHGYRGAIKQVEVSGDWGATLARVPALTDISPWRLAVVLEVAKDKAVVGLQPGRLSSGKIEPERVTGEIAFSEMKWARRVLKNGRLGGAPKSANDVLEVGDVVYVAPAEVKKDAKAKKKELEAEVEAIVEGEGENAQAEKDIPWTLMQKPAVEGALVALDPHTGRVRALVGGFSFSDGEFDRAVQARRQPGSSFKPLVYTAALDNGYQPNSIILDAPITISQGPGQKAWSPKNYEAGKAAGPSTLRLGIEKSRNLMTVRLAQDMGMPLIAEYSRRFGVYENLMPVLSMALGAGETTLLQMTAAYGMIDNGGKKIKPTLVDRIQDRYGRTIWRHDSRDCSGCSARAWDNQDEPVLKDDRKQIIDPIAAAQMVSMLEGVVQRGTGYKIKAVGRPLAGKTGTTNDEKDAWFVGFSPDLAVGVFVGFDQPKPMGRGETGGGISAPIFRDFMQLALADQPAVPFRTPPGVKMVRVNLKTGVRSGGEGQNIEEVFRDDSNPQGDSFAVIGASEGDPSRWNNAPTPQPEGDDSLGGMPPGEDPDGGGWEAAPPPDDGEADAPPPVDDMGGLF